MRLSYSNTLSILRIPTALTFSTSQLISIFVCISSLPNYTNKDYIEKKKKILYIKKKSNLKITMYHTFGFLPSTQLFAWYMLIQQSTQWIITEAWGFPGSSVVKNPPANAGVTGLIHGSGRSPREGNGNPLQFSCLGNPMDRGTWWLQAMKSQRVRHNWATKQQLCIAHCTKCQKSSWQSLHS